MEVLIFGVIWVVVLGGVGYWIAQQKQRSEFEGCALGCLLGPIGWIIEAVLPTGTTAEATHAPGGPFCEGCGIGIRPEQVPFCSVCQQKRESVDDRSSKDAGIPASGVATASAPPTGSATPSTDAPTKTCPDCAETILEAARICRFCRYEFWPADAAPPEAVGSPNAADVTLPPEAAHTAEELAEADVGEQPAEPEPTEPEAPSFEQEPPPPEPPAPDQQPAPEPGAEREEAGPRASVPPPPEYAPPPRPPYAPPPTPPPPSAQPAPPPYPPQQPQYAPPPTWPQQGQPPGQAPQGQGPWAPPPPRPPDRPRQ